MQIGFLNLIIRITEKVFAKGGLNWTKSSISTSPKRCFFRGTKLQKKCGTKKQARLNATGSSIITSTPPFANTMLCEVATFPFIFRYLEQFHFFVIILYFSIKIHSIFQRNIFRIFVFGYNY